MVHRSAGDAVMSEKSVHTNEATRITSGPVNNLTPGPDYKAVATYKGGEDRVGYGNTAAEAKANAGDRSTSYRSK